MRDFAYSDYIVPVMQALDDLGGSGRVAEVRQWIAERLELTDEELDAELPSGGSRFHNQVHWARFYLAKAGYVESSSRGVWRLTEKGRETSTLSPDAVVAVCRGQFAKREPEAVAATDPHRERVLDRLRQLTPEAFERFCRLLLRESGFEQVEVTGRSGDGGIDGIGLLQVNPLVSFKVLFQSKRYQGSVGPDKVRDFRGAMQGRADKGIIITTGTFTTDAKREAVRDGVPPIELVDREKLVDMMEQLRLGLRPVETFEIDEGFFDNFDGR